MLMKSLMSKIQLLMEAVKYSTLVICTFAYWFTILSFPASKITASLVGFGVLFTVLLIKTIYRWVQVE